jgi:RNA polymerase sigma factor (sigma-70 family)
MDRYPLLSAEEEAALFEQLHEGDESVRERLIYSNLRLVLHYAKGYQNLGLSFEDLVSEGIIGLMQSIDRFECGRDVRFATYAEYGIKKYIRLALSTHGRTVRLPKYMSERVLLLRRVRDLYQKDCEGTGTDEDLAKELGVSHFRFAALTRASAPATSLDAPLGDDEEMCFGDLLADESAKSPAEQLSETGIHGSVSELVATLKASERDVISRRFGLNGGDVETLEEIGESMGVTRERVRQIEVSGLNKLRLRGAGLRQGAAPAKQKLLSDLSAADKATVAAFARDHSILETARWMHASFGCGNPHKRGGHLSTTTVTRWLKGTHAPPKDKPARAKRVYASRFDSLTDEQRTALLQFLEEHTLEEAVLWLKEECAITASAPWVSLWRRRVCAERGEDVQSKARIDRGDGAFRKRPRRSRFDSLTELQRNELFTIAKGHSLKEALLWLKGEHGISVSRAHFQAWMRKLRADQAAQPTRFGSLQGA